jgi:hypothetical protein
MKNRLLLLAALLAAPVLHAALPDAVPYQGRLAANGTTYTGTGYFKFAVYQQMPAFPGSASLLWTNTTGATTGSPAEPATAVAWTVSNGLFALGLGDSITNMEPLPASLAPANGQRTYVRVWFSTTGAAGSFQTLSPDTELRSVPFAREAGSVAGISAANVPQLNTANTFNNVSGLTVKGDQPTWDAGTFQYVPANGTIVTNNSDSRMEFIPGLAAFRSGYTTNSTQWDAAHIGLFSTAFGFGTTASGEASTAMGGSTKAEGVFSTAMGYNNTASGESSTSMGYQTNASGLRSTAMGSDTIASGNSSTAMGTGTKAIGYGSTAMGVGTTANVYYSTAMGRETNANGESSTAMGFSTTASGDNSTAMGASTKAQADYSTAMGYRSTASGQFSTAMGSFTIASGQFSTAMGSSTIASGEKSTAMGNFTTASGVLSTALGESTTASGDFSTALGYRTTASGVISTAMGSGTIAPSYAETVIGQYNTRYPATGVTSWFVGDRLFVAGNGTSDSARADAFTVYKNGDTVIAGNAYAKSITPTSDRNAKTDIVPADTAAVLAGVVSLPIATWRFKEETATHLGPMAQDFAAAFHLGNTDKGIATVDADGVALASIQELNKRVTALTEQNAAKDAKISALEARLASIEAKLGK